MKSTIIAAGLAVMLTACGSSVKEGNKGNPFLSEYNTPYGVPPFEEITIEDYKPAFMQGMEEQKQEINAITNQRSMPDFENTIVALDQSGQLLRKVSLVFFGQNSVNTNDEMEALSRELSPIMSKHNDDIRLNPMLFARVKEVYDNQEKFNLNKEQKK